MARVDRPVPVEEGLGRSETFSVEVERVPHLGWQVPLFYMHVDTPGKVLVCMKQPAYGAGVQIHVEHLGDYINRSGGLVTVEVSATQTPPGWLLAPIPDWTVHASSTVEVE